MYQSPTIESVSTQTNSRKMAEGAPVSPADVSQTFNK